VIPDEALVRAVLTGDRQAFAPLVERHQRAAVACAFAITQEWGAAEDLAQDAFVRAFERLATCRNGAQFKSWVLSITRHMALNHVRSMRRHRHEALGDDTPGASVAPIVPDDRAQDRAALLRALQTLSPIQRTVLLLSDLEHLSHADIAARTGISLLMSRRHLSDARRLVRTFLRNPYVT
jgi:RNA polymerase sigma-70 factor (ECF subfamily)